MKEFELIARLTAKLPANKTVVTGPGDDCAVLDLGVPGHWLLFKTDAVVEGIHFTREAAPEQVGHKAMARCLSDIAAMGGTPGCAVITAGLPKDFDPAYVLAVQEGMSRLAAKYQVAIVGGETTTNPERMLISVAMLGTVARGRAILRSGARPGDAIFVTGDLGGSLLGKHLSFEPRLDEARWLNAHHEVHAMMDLSDGLAGDLPHILRASNVGAELLARAIPISRAARQQARAAGHGQEPLAAALGDGEDFELLFTVPSAQAVPLLDGWKKQFPSVRLSCIGKVTREPGLRIRNKDGVRTLQAHGYVHFS